MHGVSRLAKTLIFRLQRLCGLTGFSLIKLYVPTGLLLQGLLMWLNNFACTFQESLLDTFCLSLDVDTVLLLFYERHSH